MPRRALTEEEKQVKRDNLVKGRAVVTANQIKKREEEILRAQYPSSSSESDSDEDENLSLIHI